jgi:putative hydrolase of the HAD superfamily
VIPSALQHPAAVTFDCWATLLVEVDWTTAHRMRVQALHDAALEDGLETSFERACEVFDAAWARHMRCWEAGVATGAREVAAWAMEALGSQGQAPLAHLVEHFEEASHSGEVRALDGARDTLLALARRGVPRGLVCDTGLTPGRVVRRHLERLGLLELLDALAFSDEVGFPKPDARIFRAALEPLEAMPEGSVHIGDLRAHDVAGARAIGMTTVRIRAIHDDASELPEADLVVDDHEGFRALLLREGSTGP